MPSEKRPLSAVEFARIRESFFRFAREDVRNFGVRLLDYFWQLDYYAVVQDWEGSTERLIVFGLPKEKRSRSNAKNYFSMWKPTSISDQTLKCEIIFPKTAERPRLVSTHDPRRVLRVSTINELEGDFATTDEEYLKRLALAARSLRFK